MLYGMILGAVAMSAFFFGKVPVTFALFILFVGIVIHWCWKN